MVKVIGLDSGSTTTKGVLLEDGQIIEHYLTTTNGNPKKAMQEVLVALNYESSWPLIATGYGRKLIEADKHVTEITCHGRGARFLCESTANIIDIGGQDSKVIRLSAEGNIDEFLMNDKCAAGTGRFVEVLMHTLGESIEELDTFVAQATPVEINSMCTVFAESEVISLVGQGKQREDIALGVLHSIVSKVNNQLQRIKPRSGVIFFSGGLSNSHIICELLSEYTNQEVVTDPYAQYAGAIGAAVIGAERAERVAHKL